jgi:hypothetical protein
MTESKPWCGDSGVAVGALQKRGEFNIKYGWFVLPIAHKLRLGKYAFKSKQSTHLIPLALLRRFHILVPHNLDKSHDALSHVVQ